MYKFQKLGFSFDFSLNYYTVIHSSHDKLEYGCLCRRKWI